MPFYKCNLDIDDISSATKTHSSRARGMAVGVAGVHSILVIFFNGINAHSMDDTPAYPHNKRR